MRTEQVGPLVFKVECRINSRADALVTFILTISLCIEKMRHTAMHLVHRSACGYPRRTATTARQLEKQRRGA